MSEWIDVNEKLPKVETDVLVAGVLGCSIKYDVAGMFYTDYDETTLGWMSQSTEETTRFEVTHWMPLPKHPALHGASFGRAMG